MDSGPKGGHLEHKLAEAPSLIYVARDSHKVFANTCHNLQKDTTFGESNTHLSTFLKSTCNKGLNHSSNHFEEKSIKEKGLPRLKMMIFSSKTVGKAQYTGSA